MIRCPGSGERSDRVHSSGAIMCPACNGAYLSSGFRVADHEVEAEKPTDLEELLGAIARGWCHEETASLVMNEALAEAIADEVLPLFVKLRSALTAEKERLERALERYKSEEPERIKRHVQKVQAHAAELLAAREADQ